MKKLVLVLTFLLSVSSYAFEAKVICASAYSTYGGGYINAPEGAAVNLNKMIVEEIKKGFTNVSAPTVSQGEGFISQACVTVSKP